MQHKATRTCEAGSGSRPLCLSSTVHTLRAGASSIFSWLGPSLQITHFPGAMEGGGERA